MSNSLPTLAQCSNDLLLDSSHETLSYPQDILDHPLYTTREKRFNNMQKLGTNSSMPTALDWLLEIDHDDDDDDQCLSDSTVCSSDEEENAHSTGPVLLPEIRISSPSSEFDDSDLPITPVFSQSDLKERDEGHYFDSPIGNKKTSLHCKRKPSLNAGTAIFISSNTFDLNGAATYPSFLENTFTSISRNVIHVLLGKMEYNSIETVKQLLSFDSKPTLSSVKGIDLSKRKGSGWCYSYFKGQCTRRDCWYSHDLDTIICRHWFKGHCDKGDSCKFGHQWPSQVIREICNHEKYDPENGVVTIPSSLKVSPTCGSADRSPSLEPVSAQSIESEFPPLSPVPISNTATTNNFQGPKYNHVAKSPDFRKSFTSSSSNPSTNIKVKGPKIYKTTSYEQREFPPLPQSRPVFPSGAMLTKRYRELRKPAWDQEEAQRGVTAKLQNAAIKGDKAAQAYYEKQKAEISNKVCQLHRQAAQTMFYERNRNIDPETIKEDEELFVDLHGLNPGEACFYLNKVSRSFSGIKRHAWIVTGAGNHSKDGPKLFPAVVDHCKRNNIWYRHYENKGIEGIICVLIK
ncbi:hypothetical protein H4219_006257 [Mycoemilia scoparia]|uniref:Uncharacterized protein n=1 Tax=Mycoemilia scoparia TaxID=417184 RepID=A0A9W8DN41_9FUNG|nr:hypothetical protein H4219_006257 [Mycoemilia scoparia]